MTFDNMQKIVFKNGEYPKNADFEEQLHLLALKGTQAYFRENILTKEEAAGTKSKIREHLLSQTGEDGQSKLIRSGCLKDVADRQDKIRLAVLLHANPYALLLQACKCISLLLDDGDLFFRQIKTDCYEISGKALEDDEILVCEREQLEQDIRRLEQKIQETKDAGTVHILSRAVGAMRARVDELSPVPQKGVFADGS
jgi:hypothetical protein